MANISEASGHIYLKGQWTKEQVTNILYVLYSQSTGYDYSMDFDSNTIDQHIIDLIKDNGLHFFASGRWVFSYNLERFHNWTDMNEGNYKNSRAHTEGLPFNEYEDIRRKIMMDMVRNKLSLEFVYADLEPGCDVACKGTVTISSQYSYDTTTKEYEAQFITTMGSFTDHECNLKFLCLEIRDDTDMLVDYIYDLAASNKLVFKDENHRHVVLNIVMEKIYRTEDWMNIPAYPDYEYDEGNTKIVDMIQSVLKETS